MRTGPSSSGDSGLARRGDREPDRHRCIEQTRVIGNKLLEVIAERHVSRRKVDRVEDRIIASV
jgi:hypothetical protein